MAALVLVSKKDAANCETPCELRQFASARSLNASQRFGYSIARIFQGISIIEKTRKFRNFFQIVSVLSNFVENLSRSLFYCLKNARFVLNLSI